MCSRMDCRVENSKNTGCISMHYSEKATTCCQKFTCKLPPLFAQTLKSLHCKYWGWSFSGPLNFQKEKTLWRICMSSKIPKREVPWRVPCQVPKNLGTIMKSRAVDWICTRLGQRGNNEVAADITKNLGHLLVIYHIIHVNLQEVMEKETTLN